MADPTEPDEQPRPVVALRAIRAAYAACERVILALPARAAFDAATALAELLRDLAERAAGLRARSAARIAHNEGLSVRALARTLNLSKSKAAALLARAERENGPTPGEGGAVDGSE